MNNFKPLKKRLGPAEGLILYHDMEIGPCECGAWHTKEDWESLLKDSKFVLR